jgi:hypothetical protein
MNVGSNIKKYIFHLDYTGYYETYYFLYTTLRHITHEEDP